MFLGRGVPHKLLCIRWYIPLIVAGAIIFSPVEALDLPTARRQHFMHLTSSVFENRATPSAAVAVN